MILVGQPELADRLNAPELRQLKQRIALRCTLTPLEPARNCGLYRRPDPYRRRGCGAGVHARGGGADSSSGRTGSRRLISVLCDNALVNGFASGMRPVDRQSVLDVCRDFDFAAAPSGSSAAPPAATSAVGTIDEADQTTLHPESPTGDTGGDPATTSAHGGRFSLFGSLLSGHRSMSQLELAMRKARAAARTGASADERTSEPHVLHPAFVPAWDFGRRGRSPAPAACRGRRPVAPTQPASAAVPSGAPRATRPLQPARPSTVSRLQPGVPRQAGDG